MSSTCDPQARRPLHARSGGLVLVVDLDPRGFSTSVIALGEKLLGEPGAFMAPERMRALMAAYGIVGECAAEKRASYCSSAR